MAYFDGLILIIWPRSPNFQTQLQIVRAPSLDLALEQRKRTVYRLDGGAGSDEKLQWLVGRGYHFLAKGFSGKRACALAQQVSRWDAYDATSWLGTVQSPIDFGRPVQMMVKKEWAW